MVILRDYDTDNTLTATATASRAVVEKAFMILEAWEHQREIVGVSEVARRTGLAKSTAHRLLRILESSAVIERAGNGYRCGKRLDTIAPLLFPAHQPELRDNVLPFMQDLYELTHETVHLGILRGTQVYLAEKLHGHRRSPLRTRIGSALPMHSTALGKVLLAYSPRSVRGQCFALDLPAYTSSTVTQPLQLDAELRRVLREGAAYDRRETHHEVSCVAAPVLDTNGHAVSAISISGPTDRFNPATVVAPLRRAARAASLALAALGTDAKAA